MPAPNTAGFVVPVLGAIIEYPRRTAMLYRCVYALHGTYGHHEPEAHAFVDALTTTDAQTRLYAILPHIYACSADDIEVYNIFSEPELIDQAAGPPASGDCRLLECGSVGDTPLYVVSLSEPTLPLLLVSHAQRVRLTCALAQCPAFPA
jgi:hypothetical protein